MPASCRKAGRGGRGEDARQISTLRPIGSLDILIRISSKPEAAMPLYIKDDTTARLVDRLARLRGLSKQDAVKLAVQAELERTEASIPLRDRFSVLRATHRLPPTTGEVADKAFFDELSGDL
jgi:antitoxin VapB